MLEGLSDGLVTVFPPMGLDEHTVDLFEVHDAGLVTNCYGLFCGRTFYEIGVVKTRVFWPVPS